MGVLFFAKYILMEIIENLVKRYNVIASIRKFKTVIHVRHLPPSQYPRRSQVDNNTRDIVIM